MQVSSSRCARNRTPARCCNSRTRRARTRKDGGMTGTDKSSRGLAPDRRHTGKPACRFEELLTLATVAVAGEQRPLRSQRVLPQQAGSRCAQLARLRLRLFLKDIFGNRPTGPRPLGLNRHGADVSSACHAVTTPDRTPSSLPRPAGDRAWLVQIRQCRRRRDGGIVNSPACGERLNSGEPLPPPSAPTWARRVRQPEPVRASA
jgi:hypothetical protein